jgi:hypothetical protein
MDVIRSEHAPVGQEQSLCIFKVPAAVETCLEPVLVPHVPRRGQRDVRKEPEPEGWLMRLKIQRHFGTSCLEVL